MSGADEFRASARAAADAVTASLTAQVEEILAEAERSAVEIRLEVEAESTQRAVQIRVAAERDAARIRREAEEQAARYLEQVRGQLDDAARGRLEHLGSITAELAARAEEVLARLHEAATVRRQLDELLDTLGVAAEVAAREARRDALHLRSIEQPGS